MRRWHSNPSGQTRRIGGKNGSKRHLLVGGRGVPLSRTVTEANVNDCKRLHEVLSAIMVKRESPPSRRHKHLCADAGYRGADNARPIERHDHIAHVVSRRKEADIKWRDPKKKARRWVVEVCHSWFNRFRKLLVRYEKLECRTVSSAKRNTPRIIGQGPGRWGWRGPGRGLAEASASSAWHAVGC